MSCLSLMIEPLSFSSRYIVEVSYALREPSRGALSSSDRTKQAQEGTAAHPRQHPRQLGSVDDVADVWGASLACGWRG